MKKGIFIAIKVCFFAGLFLFLFRPETFGFAEDKFGDLSIAALWEELQTLKLSTALFWFTFAALIKIAGIFCGVFRWHFLLKAQGITLPFWYLTKCWFTGRAIGLVLPGTVGLDGYRLVESAAYTGEVIKCTTVIAVEKLTGIVALGLLVIIALVLGTDVAQVNMLKVAVILIAMLGVVFLLLLNPRIVQILVAVTPIPGKLRDKVDKMGEAVSAYSGHRFTLMIALFLALGVHLGICLMYFGIAMGISGGEASFWDLMFASPLIIAASVITPTVSGLGVREGGMTLLLGAKYGETATFLWGHLGLWVGEAIPFLLSMPLILLAGRPDRAKFLSELESVREKSAEEGKEDKSAYLSSEETEKYRQIVYDCLGVGVLAGLIGGALLGLTESIWHVSHLANVTETSALWWAPLVYGIAMIGLALGLSLVMLFGHLFINRFVPAAVTFGLALGGTMGTVFLVFGRFRYARDLRGETGMSIVDNLIVLGITAAIIVIAVGAGSILAGWVKNSRFKGIVVGGGCYITIVLVGVIMSMVYKPGPQPVVKEMFITNDKPNVYLIVVDTLRADYLTAFNASAKPNTPNISALAEDSVVFQNTYAQSSWTKASFGTIFSGMYPEAHTATGKASGLPDDVTTITEVLYQAGYYTVGYSNNPNITSVFNYNQGFRNYTDLKPDLLLGAKASSEKLVLYDILRKVIQKVNAKVFKGRINITDFYQPANVVTDTGLDWLSTQTGQEESNFLFLHYMDPHDPFRDPDQAGKGYARVQMGNPDPEIYKDIFIKSYSYEIEYMDEHLGRFIQGLKDKGLYDDALIIFTADHGEEFYEHGGWWHGLSLYDEQIAIPLMIKVPNSEITEVNTDLARHVDIAPTIATLVGLPVDEQWQGKSLISESLDLQNADTAYVHSHLNFEGIELRGLRTGTRKLIEANEGNKRNYAPIEFYNLESDPGEQDNIAQDSKAEVELFQKSLDSMNKFIQENASEPMDLSTEGMSEELREQLDSLGYGGDTVDENLDF